MVAFDNNILCLSIHPDAKGTHDAKDRVEFLLSALEDRSERIILPTPALAEFLVLAADDAPEYLEKLRENSVFRIEPFDERAAIELAHVELTARRRGGKRSPAETSVWQKVKFDRQIVAIAKVNGASCIYSNDPDVVKHASDFGIEAKTVFDLPKPPAVQSSLFQPPGHLQPPAITSAAECPYCGQPWKNETFPLGWDSHAETVCRSVEHLPQSERKAAFRKKMEDDGYL